MNKLLHRIGRALTNLGKKMGSKTQLILTQYAEASLPTVFGEFLTTVYRDQNQEETAILISYNLTPDSCPFVRVHSECFTGEVLGSLKCDCRDQLNLALAEIQKRGSGAIIYLRQEGRGIGLGNKIRAYHLQNQGADTIEANHQLGFDTDLRSFEGAALILRQRGVKEVILNTNNPDKIQALTHLGIVIRERVPSLAEVNKFNEDYLKTKMQKLGHQLNGLFH
ncbi:MAG TPA: GTP cyclohydrolase II [Oligoflexus sp.]|uniref:GTP cyclohydrolase II n=1 Tax=Oligoflexus sp. TaxID=1971216 RepID=UPI002D2F5714|nr:GTP cyclohydrolase II [Oligoflexus sp.]HYX33004.1 GTP cyclohydrolase II [Oligoflexus sp.]